MLKKKIYEHRGVQCVERCLLLGINGADSFQPFMYLQTMHLVEQSHAAWSEPHVHTIANCNNIYSQLLAGIKQASEKASTKRDATPGVTTCVGSENRLRHMCPTINHQSLS